MAAGCVGMLLTLLLLQGCSSDPQEQYVLRSRRRLEPNVVESQRDNHQTEVNVTRYAIDLSARVNFSSSFSFTGASLLATLD